LKYLNFITFLVLFSVFGNSCVMNKTTEKVAGKVFKKQTVGYAPEVTMTSVAIINNQLFIKGTGFDTVSKVQIKDNSLFNESFIIESKTNNIIIANSSKSISFLMGKVFDLLLSNAYGASTYQITQNIQNGSITSAKLSPMGASAGQYLKWNGTSWQPSTITPLMYQGVWKADGTGVNISSGGIPGEYYIVDTVGTTNPNTNIVGLVTWNVGDWVIWNDNSSLWERVPNIMAPVTGDITGNYPNLTIPLASINDSKISDVYVSKITSGLNKYFTYKPNNGSCSSGDVLQFDSTPGIVGWVCGTKSSTSNITAVAASNSADLNLASGIGDINFKTNSTDTQFTIKQSGLVKLGPDIGISKFSVGDSVSSPIMEIGKSASYKGSMKWDNTNNFLSFGTKNSTSYNDTLVIKDGKVGIGTITPSTKLDVVGDIFSSGSITWGEGGSRTEVKNDAGKISSQSGFFQASAPVNYYSGATGWQHLIESRHSNNSNNYALQIAGSFFDQNLYFRKSNNSATTSWNRFIAENSLGNVGIGMTAPLSKLAIKSGAIETISNTGAIRNYRDVLQFDQSASSIPNSIFKITMPKTWSNTMIRMVISGYNYTSNTGSWKVILSGYNYSPTTSWINTSTQIEGTPPFQRIRFAHDGTKNVILLGDLTTTWSYPKINISEFMAGHSGNSGWGSGWSGSFITSEAGIANIAEPQLRGLFLSTSGNVGIGTTTPSQKLDVNGNANINRIIGGQLNGVGNFHLDATSTGSTYLNWYTGSGGVSVGNATSAGYGAILASAFTVTSDRRLKKDIQQINEAVKKIKKINGVTFYYKNKKFDQRHQVGVIAQDVKKVFPELVNTDKKTGFYNVNYAGLVAPLIEATKEQQDEIESNKNLFLTMNEGLGSKVAVLERKIAALEEENLEIKTLLCLKFPKAKLCN